ncbi:hypothetical protein JX266_011626 [Neoarthrinium moseri]|nr:hypothetical protein JX266_011626 [Neoarthrinium moseri]
MSKDELTYAGTRLPVVANPIVEGEKRQNGHALNHRDQESLPIVGDSVEHPEFEKHHSASPVELFYDLWFVANLSVFTSIHNIYNSKSCTSFIGYIVMLWTTWNLTTLHDVRFYSDSIVERCARAMHLGVMIGFAIIGTQFDPDHQVKGIFQAMSLFLAVSRLVLAIQYTQILLQTLRHRKGKLPLLCTVLFHVVAAAIYFGISWRFDSSRKSRVYVIWYALGPVEVGVNLVMSKFSRTLSFTGTHLAERFNLLTLIILGEGGILLAKNITYVVKDTYGKDDYFGTWSPQLIGIVTASTALIYLLFQIYYDWMHDTEMSKHRQAFWAAFHLPVHVSLLLLLAGSSQFILWQRARESADLAVVKLSNWIVDFSNYTSSEKVGDKVSGIVYTYLSKYPPENGTETLPYVNGILDSIYDMPDAIWSNDTLWSDLDLINTDPDATRVTENFQELMFTLVNAVYAGLHVEPAEIKENNNSGNDQQVVTDALHKATRIVFIYVFACAGLTLFLMTMLHILTKRHGWSMFNILRTLVITAVAISLAFASIAGRKGHETEFVGSPWMLPSITICYFGVLVLTHIPHPPILFWKRKYAGYNNVEKTGPPPANMSSTVYPPYQHKSFTYICEHPEEGTPSPFIARLLDRSLIQPHADNQLLVQCPQCLDRCSEEERHNSVAATLVVGSEGPKDTMTILVIFANLWPKFRKKATEDLVDLLQQCSEALGKVFSSDNSRYRRVLGTIRDHCGPMLALDVARIVSASMLDYRYPLCTGTANRWSAYSTASCLFWDRLRHKGPSGEKLPVDLQHVTGHMLEQGIGYVTEVLGPPQEKHLHVDILKDWCKLDTSLREEDLYKLQRLMRGVASAGRRFKIQLHQLSRRKSWIVSVQKELDELALEVAFLNSTATKLMALDVEKRKQWTQWRELTASLDERIDAVLQNKVRHDPAGFI